MTKERYDQIIEKKQMDLASYSRSISGIWFDLHKEIFKSLNGKGFQSISDIVGLCCVKWDVSIAELIQHSEGVLFRKRKEYSVDTDLLHNFRVGSQLTGMSMQGVCFMFALKHIVSILDMTGEEKKDYIFEKLGDLFNYSILYECCMEEDA